MKTERINVLFVCAKNQWRSPTGEQVYRNDPRVAVRSAGVSSKARRKVHAGDMAWADLILVMERKHCARLREQFMQVEEMPTVECLDIPDDYEFMDPELIELIKDGTEYYLEQLALNR